MYIVRTVVHINIKNVNEMSDVFSIEFKQLLLFDIIFGKI